MCVSVSDVATLLTVPGQAYKMIRGTAGQSQRSSSSFLTPTPPSGPPPSKRKTPIQPDGPPPAKLRRVI